MIAKFLEFRECAAHILEPVYSERERAFFVNGNDAFVQRQWARENGLGPRVCLSHILLAQIEAHRTEVFYTLDPTSLEEGFIKKLPGCVKKKIAWHASPLRNVAFTDYDLVVCNFPSILARLRQLGARTEYFVPAHDPELGRFAGRQDRPIDLLFVGGYSRHHTRRAAMLEAVAGLSDRYEIALHLDRSRLCRLAESPLGYLLPLAKHRRPPHLAAISRTPVFGIDMYELMSRAKIILNGAIDMVGAERGNMRCFEALGSSALLLSDEGVYPEGMVDGETLIAYKSSEDAVVKIQSLLEAPGTRLKIGRAGFEMLSSRYSKQAQWTRFQTLVGAS